MSITSQEGHDFWRERARRYVHAKFPESMTNPEQLRFAIANVGSEYMVDVLFDELLEKKDVKAEWANRKMITAAVDSLLFETNITHG
ncbi:hypothetical protein [Pseudomonas mohnii]